VGLFRSSQTKSIDETIKMLINDGKYKQAVDLMDKASSNNRLDVKMQLNIAWIYAFNNEFNKSLKISDELIKDNPDWQEIYYLRGFVYQKAEKYNEALKNYKKAVEIDPKDTKSYASIAEIHQLLGNYNESINYYLQVINIDPENYVYHLDLANVYFKKGDYKLSLEEAEKAFKYSPESDREKIRESLENIRLNVAISKP